MYCHSLTRAVHIELVSDMANLSFFSRAFIHFTNLYDVLATIFSDNPKMFWGSGQWFSKLIYFHKFQKFGTCIKRPPLFCLVQRHVRKNDKNHQELLIQSSVEEGFIISLYGL